MSVRMIEEQLRSLLSEDKEGALPLPGGGQTWLRHRRLMNIGRTDLSLARLAEAHWDAIAILVEAGHTPAIGATYGVWASEIPGQPLILDQRDGEFIISGTKMFCSGAGIIDRALVTTTSPQHRLIDIDLRENAGRVSYDHSAWQTAAFAETCTGTVTFSAAKVEAASLVGVEGWYLDRPGFWHGACGPAACWAGGAVGLLDCAMKSARQDPHTLAHLAAMYADTWVLQAVLDTAGRQIDAEWADQPAAHIRALTVRHLVEQSCTDVLRRFARAYGPAPLAMQAETSRRYHELDLYLRQSHAERDLEALGRCLKPSA